MRRFVLMAALAVFVGTAVAHGQVDGGSSAESNQGSQTPGAQVSVSSSSDTKLGTKSADAQTSMKVRAVLIKGLDARKAKPGDPVVARTTEELRGIGNFRIPKNAKLLGHVTQVQARGKGQSSSTLAIAFEKAQMKDGREIPVQAIIQAMAPPEDEIAMEKDNAGMGSVELLPTQPLLGGVKSNVNSTAATTGNPASSLGSAEGSTSAVGGAATSTVGPSADGTTTLNAASHGAIGMKGLQLDGAASNSSQASVIHSSSENIRLESGTRLVLHVSMQ